MQAQEPNYAQGYHVPEKALNTAGEQAYDRFMGTTQVAMVQREDESRESGLSSNQFIG